MLTRNAILVLVVVLTISCVCSITAGADSPDIETLMANYRTGMAARGHSTVARQSREPQWFKVPTSPTETPRLSIFDRTIASHARWLSLAATEQEATNSETGEVADTETGTDPRDFSNKFMPYYRFTQLRNGMEIHEYTLFGLHAFRPDLAMTYELPVAKNVKSATLNLPPGMDFDEWGMGDLILRLFWRPKVQGVTEFEFSLADMPGPRAKGNISIMPLLEMTLPTHTDDLLGADEVIVSPGFVFVKDMPMMGFVAAMNFLDIGAAHWDGTDYTLRYRSRIFYMQPLSKPGPGFLDGWYLLPEMQPVYDFNENHFSFWIAPEIWKIVTPGKLILYGKPGWGWLKKWDRESGGFDREFTFEFGMRVFL